MNIAATVSSPAVTRSLNMEFDVETPPGYDGGYIGKVVLGAGPSTQSTGQTQPLVASATMVVTLPTSHMVSLNTSLPVFTPTSDARDYYYQLSQPIHTFVVEIMPQLYPPTGNFQFPPLYSAALTAVMSTPAH
ncbi:hypothetical protein Hanom_Chr00s000001g01597851 [Helianthus anomalus]